MHKKFEGGEMHKKFEGGEMQKKFEGRDIIKKKNKCISDLEWGIQVAFKFRNGPLLRQKRWTGTKTLHKETIKYYSSNGRHTI